MKLTEVPKICDACQKPYSNVPLQRKMQKKAWLLIAAAAVVTVAWTACIAGVAWLTMTPERYALVDKLPIIPVVAVLILFLCVPGIPIVARAFTMPTSVRRLCGYCKVEREFVIENRGAPAPPAAK